MVAATSPDAIKMEPVKSSKLLAIGYDDALFILRASFNPSGSQYDYFDVEPERHAELMKAPSLGQYFGEHIAGKRGAPPPYPFAKLGTPAHEAMWKNALGEPVAVAGDDHLAGAPSAAELNERAHAGKVLSFSDVKGSVNSTTIEGELPRQRSRSQQLAEVVVETIPPVELPSDEKGLTEHATAVVNETNALVVAPAPGAPMVLAVKTPEHYAHTLSVMLAKKDEMKRALAEVAKIKNPATEAWKAACAFENKVKASYEGAIALLDQACVGYRREVAEEERRANEAEQRERQRILDEQHAREVEEANQRAAHDAEALRAAGQHEVAAEVEAKPAYVPRPVAQPVVARTAVPAVAGARILKTWKFRVDDPTLVVRFYMDDIRAALQRRGLTMGDDDLGAFTMDLGKTFAQLHSLDEVKVGGRVRPLKQAAVGLIPGVTVYPDEKTGSTGR